MTALPPGSIVKTALTRGQHCRMDSIVTHDGIDTRSALSLGQHQLALDFVFVFCFVLFVVFVVIGTRRLRSTKLSRYELINYEERVICERDIVSVDSRMRGAKEKQYSDG